MINKKIIIISLLIVILMSVQSVSASDDADINIIGDNGDNGVLQAPNNEETYIDSENVINSDSSEEITLDYATYDNGGDSNSAENDVLALDYQEGIENTDGGVISSTIGNFVFAEVWLQTSTVTYLGDESSQEKDLTLKNSYGDLSSIVGLKYDDITKNNVAINDKDYDKVDLKLTKTVNATKAYVGDFVVYTITVSNKGSVNATGVSVHEDLLEGLSYISDDSRGEYYPSIGIWDIGDLNPGETRVLNILVQLTKAGNILNYAIVVANQEIENITSSYENVTIEVVEHGAKSKTGNGALIHQKADVRLKETGNPLMILMIVLLSACVCLRHKQ